MPWIMPLLVLYMLFVLMTWFARPLSNLLLRLNRFGWYALTADQRRASNWLGACLVIAGVGVAAYFGTGEFLALLVAGFAVGMAFPLVTIYSCQRGWPRQAMTYYVIAMAVVGIATIVCAALNLEAGATLVTIFIFGFAATPWLANYLASATPRR
jgi:hypothetical protein